ncbi:AMP-binding protein [Actinokineospora sp. PR83]|uniref:AMP-binding protein n=1 Tax=Actinokineospora sp. PR83 TaxID=2884908 RepID=UPI0027E075EC|nr:AMP-binding protein [Actinokineospora sp. PR83]MCG8920684.1 AMP-binding protein [Actinokineospora sp. PR83]
MIEVLSCPEGTAGGRFFFPDSGEVLTRVDLVHRANGLAAELLRAGAGQGDVVGILLPTTPAFLPALIGTMSSGAAACVLPMPAAARDADAVADELAAHIRAVGIRHVVTGHPFTAVLGPVVERCPGLTVIDAGSCPVLSRRPTDLVIAGGDQAIVQFTSGSTARPRAVSLTHQAVLSAATAPIERCEMSTADVGYQWLPLFHDFGMIGLMISLCAGFDMHLTTPATFIKDPAGALRYFTEHGVSICTGPNFAYDRLATTAAAGDLPGVDLGRWRLALNGGEQVSAGTVDRFTEVLGRYGLPGTAMTPAYGMAEFCAGISIGRPGLAPSRVTVDRTSLVDGQPIRTLAGGSGWELVGQGPPLPGTRVRVVDAHGTALPEDHVGELEVSGTSLMSGYLHDPAATGEVLRGGWLRTGDRGFLRGGEIHVSGRIKDMIIVHGRNVHAEDVEAVVRHVPGVYRRHCAAVADHENERVVVVVETVEPDRAAVAEAVRRAIGERLGLSGAVVHTVARNQLPRTTSGKWRRAEIRRGLQAKEEQL